MSKNTFFSNLATITCKGKIIDLSTPKIMGIINVTPDSFYAGSRKQNESEIVDQARKMLDEGADFLDLGAYSTRPNAQDNSTDEELDRLIPAIENVCKEFPEAILSADTFRAIVAKEAVNAGAAMINDISAGRLDNNMAETIAKLGVPYVAMHSRGTPQTMQSLNEYNDIILDIMDELLAPIQTLRNKGVKDIMIDPGFGFAKNSTQNFELLNRLSELSILNLPILVGISRKSMIYKTLEIPTEEALNGTTVLHSIALQKGASILRVHDVLEAKQCIKLLSKLNQKKL